MAARLLGVDYGAAPRGMSSGLVRPVRWIVLHATANTASARAEARYAATRTDDRSRWTSAHFYIDDREIIGSVPLDRQAWAAYHEANEHGWHLEMCGISDRVPAATIARTAGLVAQLAELDKVPVRRCTPSMVADHARGICGHADITEGLRVGTHTDPGEHFDWAEFIEMVEGDDVSAQEVWAEKFTSPYDGRDLPAQVFLRYTNKETYANGDRLAELMTTAAAIQAQLAQVLGRDPVDEEQIVQGVLTGLGRKDPQTIASALLAVMPAEQAQAVGRILVGEGTGA